MESVFELAIEQKNNKRYEESVPSGSSSEELSVADYENDEVRLQDEDALSSDYEMKELYHQVDSISFTHGVLKCKSQTVTVHCNSNMANGKREGVYTIHIGRGKQSFRWLGLAAAQRYHRDIKTGFGKLRQRETEAPRVLAFHIPTNFYCKRGKEVPPNPRLKLRDVLVHGSHVYFEFDHNDTLIPTKVVNPRIEIADDPDEPPCSQERSGMLAPQSAVERKGSEWFKACYQTHPSRARRMRKAHRVGKQMVKSGKTRRKKNLVAPEEWENVFITRHEQSEKERIRLCTYEVKRSKILKENTLVSPEDHSAILNILISHYHYIEELFVFACSLDSSTPTNQMSKLEFMHFCEHTGIRDAKDLVSFQQDLNYLFIATNVEKDENNHIIRDHFNNANTFLRFEFLEALVRLSIMIMQKRVDAKSLSTPERLEKFLVEYIDPVASELHRETIHFRMALTSPKTLKVYHEHRKRFEKVFTIYAKREDGAKYRGSGYLGMYDKERLTSWDLGEFILFLRDAGVLADDSNANCKMCTTTADIKINSLTRREGRIIFAQSMQLSTSNKESMEINYYRQTQLNYVEFLEAVARVAMRTYGQDHNGFAGYHIADALHQFAINHMRDLVVETTKVKRHNHSQQRSGK